MLISNAHRRFSGEGVEAETAANRSQSSSTAAPSAARAHDHRTDTEIRGSAVGEVEDGSSGNGCGEAGTGPCRSELDLNQDEGDEQGKEDDLPVVDAKARRLSVACLPGKEQGDNGDH